jgi:hypothetical protein
VGQSETRNRGKCPGQKTFFKKVTERSLDIASSKRTPTHMDHIIRKGIQIELHPNNINGDDGYSLRRS